MRQLASALTVSVALFSALVTTAASAAASPERPRECEDIAAASEATLRADYGYEAAKVAIDVEELCLQINDLPSSVGFYDAAVLAAKSFLNDASHPESPIAIARTAVDGEGGDGSIDAQARALLMRHLALRSTSIRLVAQGESPEGGEDVADAWIVELKVPTLSDHTYWAVIPRDGGAVYNYGFN
jgi:hypothetical protein